MARKNASESKSSSSSKTWEGIKGYEAEFIGKGDLSTDLGPVRDKQTPDMMTKEEFAKNYGFIYGDEIDQAYESAMNAKYDELDAGTRQARDTQLQDMSSSHDQYLNSLRQQRAKAPQTGIQKGSSMAAELQGMFGSQNQMQESQQHYADTMGKLTYERGTAAEEARLGALRENNAISSDYAQKGIEKYGYDVQNEAAYLGYLGEYGQNQGNMMQAAGVWNQAEGQNTHRQTSQSDSSSFSYDDSANISADAQRYSSDQSLKGQRYASDKQYDGTRYSADQSLTGQKYSADQSYKGQTQSANTSAAAQRYAADQARRGFSSGGGGSSSSGSGGSSSSSVGTSGGSKKTVNKTAPSKTAPKKATPKNTPAKQKAAAKSTTQRNHEADKARKAADLKASAAKKNAATTAKHKANIAANKAATAKAAADRKKKADANLAAKKKKGATPKKKGSGGYKPTETKNIW